MFAMGYATLSICSHKSNAMMSAPSSANLTACERPCPLAAPVMKATFPSSCDDMIDPLVRR